MIYSHSKAKSNAFAIVVVFLSLLLATFFGLSNSVKAQGTIGSFCAKEGITKEICGGDTIIKLKCYRANCHGQDYYNEQYLIAEEERERCGNVWRGCTNKCNEEWKICILQPDKTDQICLDESNACTPLCDKASEQCHKGSEDKYEESKKCSQPFQWKKSNEVVCGTGTQCVQNGDDAKCVRSSGQPVSPPAENAPSATPEAITSQPIENTPAIVPEVEALVEKTPTNEDIPTPSKTEQAPENWGEATVVRMTGGADMQLVADGPWQTVSLGTKIPLGAKLFSSYASEVTLEFPNHLVIVVLALSELDIDNPTDYVKKAPRLKLGTGDVRFKVNQGDFRTDMQVSTPVSTGAVTGTDFAVSYNKETGVAIWEIYDHSIEVRSNSTGEIKTISSSYGQPIKRIEVAKDGAMTEQVAIPKDEWQVRKAQVALQSQPEGNRSNGLFWVLIFLGLGGTVFALYKTGKLRPMLQRVSALARRDDSKPL